MVLRHFMKKHRISKEIRCFFCRPILYNAGGMCYTNNACEDYVNQFSGCGAFFVDTTRTRAAYYRTRRND